jgi:hypothetical protein
MRYWRIQYTLDGQTHVSDPLPTWVSAELYRRELVAAGAVESCILEY